MRWTNFCTPPHTHPLKLHVKFGFHWPGGFWGEDVWSVFPNESMKKQVTPGAGPLLLQGFNLTILVGINKIKHIPNTKGPGPLVSDKKIFKVLPIRVLPMEVYIENNFDLSVKKSRSTRRFSFFSDLYGPCHQCCIPSLRAIGPLVQEKKILKGFYHTWARQPTWSCGPDAANKLSFPLPVKALCEFRLWLAQCFLWRQLQ